MKHSATDDAAQLKEHPARELLALLKAVSAEGHLSRDEVDQLNDWMEHAKNRHVPAMVYLQKHIRDVIDEHYVTEAGRKDMVNAILQVMPESVRRQARLRLGREAQRHHVEAKESPCGECPIPMSKRQWEIITALDLKVPDDCTYAEAQEIIIKNVFNT